MSLILSSSCWVFSDVTARCVHLSNRHLLIISVFKYPRHIPCTMLNWSSFPFFHSLCLGDSVFVRILPCFFPWKFSQWSFWFALGSRHYVDLSLFYAMQALHSLGSLQCVRGLQCPQTRRRIFWVQPLALFQPQSLAMEVPLLLVSCNFLRQLQFWSHHLPRSATQTFPVRWFPSITQCLSCPTFASHNHLRPVRLISLVFPSLPILILFMTCAAKRGSQLSKGLSSAIRTLVFCSAEIRRVLHCRFTSLTAISTRPLAMWSPSGDPCGITSTPTHAWITASWSAFVLGSLSHFKMILRKPRSFMKPKKKWNGVCKRTFPFKTCRSRLTIRAVWTNQNWKRVCVFLCQKTEVESYDRSRSFSSNSLIRCCPPTPQPSTQAAHQLQKTACPQSSCFCFCLLVGFFGFILTLGISASKGSSSSSFPISTSARDSPTSFITNGCYIPIQSFRWTYERTALPSPFPDCWLFFARRWSASFTLLVSVDFTSRFK